MAHVASVPTDPQTLVRIGLPGGIVVDKLPGRPDPDSRPRPAVLADIRRTPLHRIAASQVDAVVRRTLNEERGAHAVDVAMFNSSI